MLQTENALQEDVTVLTHHFHHYPPARYTRTRSVINSGRAFGFNLVEIGIAFAIVGIFSAIGILGWANFSESSDINTINTVRGALQSTIAQSIDAFETPSTRLNATTVLNLLRANNALEGGVVITPAGVNVSDGFTIALNTGNTREATLTVSPEGQVNVTAITGFSSVTMEELNSY